MTDRESLETTSPASSHKDLPQFVAPQLQRLLQQRLQKVAAVTASAETRQSTLPIIKQFQPLLSQIPQKNIQVSSSVSKSSNSEKEKVLFKKKNYLQ